MQITEYETKDGVLYVNVMNQDGSCFSMPKADWVKLQAQRGKHLTENPTEDVE